MKKILAFMVAMLFLFSGCSCNGTYGGAPGTPLIVEDMDVTYNGIVLNGNVSIEEIEQKLGVKLIEEGENIEIREGLVSETCDFYSRVLFYPNKQNVELSISYIINETLGITKIDSIRINKGTVGRGVYVGDSLSALLKAYGEPIEKDYYRYFLNSDGGDYSIHFVVDETEKIIEISLYYTIAKTLEEWGITYESAF